MGKGIILRVLDGTVLSPELSHKLDELLPGYELKYFNEKPNYKESIKRRMDSLHDAFLFLLDAYPLDPQNTLLNAETLKNYVAECKASCDLTKETVEELHKELEQYTARLIETISIGWNWTKDYEVSEAIEALNEAEQYVIMTRGRPDLATLTPIQIGDNIEYILQYDESLPPYDQQFLGELNALKSIGFPKTPLWFRNNLPEYQQAYFCNLRLGAINPTTVMQDINDFIALWDRIKKESLNISTDFRQINSNLQPYPAWFNGLSHAHKAMVQELSRGSAFSVDSRLAALKKFVLTQKDKIAFNTMLPHIAALPQWYWSLSKVQQSFLERAIQSSDRIEDAVSYLSSRHRTLPIPANYAVHSLYKIDKDGNEKLLHGKRYRSSHVVSRDVLDLPQAVQQRHSDSNFAKVTEFAGPDQIGILQTLISPLHAMEYVPSFISDYLPDLPPDLELFKLARTTVKHSERASKTMEHNHPFNIAKLWYYTTSTDEDSLRLLATAQNAVANTPGLQELLDDYRNVLESPMGSATVWDYVGRELFLSSLEQLIILHLGGHSYGSCVSGKDRKAVELMHTDAMMFYKEKYGSWPKYGVPSDVLERVNFVELFTDIYMTRHQHEHAGQNAPGSEGIKTPHWYLPKDCTKSINSRLGTKKGLAYDDRLASDNEVKNISKVFSSYFFKKNELLCKLTVRQLGEVLCTKLYDALTSLINEISLLYSKKDSWMLGLFDKKSPGNLPAGIKTIRGVIHNQDSGNDNVLRMEKICAAVLERPESDSSRSDVTTSIYGKTRSLLKQPFETGQNLESLTEGAVAEWNALFEKSKKENSSAQAASSSLV